MLLLKIVMSLSLDTTKLFKRIAGPRCKILLGKDMHRVLKTGDDALIRGPKRDGSHRAKQRSGLGPFRNLNCIN